MTTMRIHRSVLEDLEEYLEVTTMSDSFTDDNDPEDVDLYERLHDRLAVLREESGKKPWIEAGEFDDDETEVLSSEADNRLNVHQGNLKMLSGMPARNTSGWLSRHGRWVHQSDIREYDALEKVIKAYQMFLRDLRQ